MSLQGEFQRRLYKELVKNYNPLERPVANDSQPLTVYFSLSLLQIMDVVSLARRSGYTPSCPGQGCASGRTPSHLCMGTWVAPFFQLETPGQSVPSWESVPETGFLHHFQSPLERKLVQFCAQNSLGTNKLSSLVTA